MDITNWDRPQKTDESDFLSSQWLERTVSNSFYSSHNTSRQHTHRSTKVLSLAVIVILQLKDKVVKKQTNQDRLDNTFFKYKQIEYKWKYLPML